MMKRLLCFTALALVLIGCDREADRPTDPSVTTEDGGGLTLRTHEARIRPLCISGEWGDGCYRQDDSVFVGVMIQDVGYATQILTEVYWDADEVDFARVERNYGQFTNPDQWFQNWYGSHAPYLEDAQENIWALKIWTYYGSVDCNECDNGELPPECEEIGEETPMAVVVFHKDPEFSGTHAHIETVESVFICYACPYDGTCCSSACREITPLDDQEVYIEVP